MALIGKVKGARQKPEVVHCASGREIRLMVAVDYTEGVPQDQEARMALLASPPQRLFMVALQKQSERRPSLEQKLAGKYQQRAKKLRSGHWTMVIWPRIGGINSSNFCRPVKGLLWHIVIVAP